ncbi:restriction endonuclease subunit S [Gillisia limnaea]|uniref:Restriction modification system DNA specificity domain-containing protein n=1 Tax=Gillisia limnaea (strain DSM 15749 / LMG 21470 / R-8282) TaxID=865937 RepID=H2BVS0_GILLR|nr:restriction endonuclease subunit S [Gillisia limnaea]EHQ04026.1 restriction modification system DNA specificity domain-containing protein [Gillisia limnaea DSM 15749]
MRGFRFERLKDVVKRVKVGFVGPVNDFYCSSDVIGSVPIIRTTDIDDFNLKQLKYVTLQFHKKNKKSQLFKGDLIIARHGSNGNAMVYELEEEAQVLNAVIIRPDVDIISSKLLKLHFDSPFIKDQIKGSVKGSVQGVINTQHVADLMVPIFDSINYSNATKIISDLDAKIEVNNKINQKLEAMAITLYDYWFVQFDFPDPNGEPYKSSGGTMVFNEELKREIPEGWEVDSLSAWIKNDKSGDWGKETEEGNYVIKVSCIRGADLNGLNGKGEVKSPTRYVLEKNSHKLMEVGDFIIEISGGSPTQSTGRMAFITKETIERFENPLICSNFCKAVTLKKEKALYNFAYEWNRLYDAGVLFGWEGKTSGIKNLLFESFVTNHQVVIPDDIVMAHFYDYAKPIQAQKQTYLKENQKLAELRDWLLPMLMNGQVTVGEAEEQLGMVAEEREKYN